MSVEESKIGLILNVLFEQWKFHHKDEKDADRIRLHEIDGQFIFPTRGTDGGISNPHAIMLTATLHFYNTEVLDLSLFKTKPAPEAIDYLRDRLHHGIEEFRRYLSSIERFASDASDPSAWKVEQTSADDTEQAAQRPEGSLPQG